MAEDQNNGLALKSSDGYTGKLFLPSTADIATLNTAQASVNTIDPTARFIVSSTEPETADDGKIWITVEGGAREYITESITAEITNTIVGPPTIVEQSASFNLQNIVVGTNVLLSCYIDPPSTGYTMLKLCLVNTSLCFSQAGTSTDISDSITYTDDLKTVTVKINNPDFLNIGSVKVATTNSVIDDASCTLTVLHTNNRGLLQLYLTYTHYV